MSRHTIAESLSQAVIDDNEDDIDLRQYLQALWKYRWLILAIAVVVTLCAALVIFSIQPTFRATATVLIETQEKKVVSIEEVYGLPSAQREYFETQNQILKSRELAEKVIDKLNIFQHPEFDPKLQKTGFSLDPRQWIPKSWLGKDDGGKPPTPHDLRNRLVQQFAGQLRVSPIRNSQLIALSFDSRYPELAAAVPNMLAEVYIDSNLENRLAMTRRAADWITERLDALRGQVEASEQALQDFREQEQLVDVKGVVDSLAAKQLDEITEDLVAARRDLGESEALYRQVSALEDQASSALASIPAVLGDTNVQRAREVEAAAQRRVSELGKRYGPKHPKMIAAAAERDAAAVELGRQINNVIESIEKRYRVAQAKERELARALDSSKGEMVEINRKEHSLRTLEREVQTNRQLYDMFLTRFKETDVAGGGGQVGNARLVDPAVIPSIPYKPNKKLLLLIALFLSLVGGVSLAFLLEFLDNSMKDSADVEKHLQLPVLAMLPVLPELQEDESQLFSYYIEHGASGFSESIRTLRTSVLLSNVDDKKKAILITSSLPSEGKSVIAVNLALSLAQMGKTLLLEADLRRPSITRILGGAKRAGLSEFISGTLPADECMHYFKRGEMYVMSAGAAAPKPLELLSSERFARAIEKLKDEFDHIVIDSAPTIMVSDALVISRYARNVIYVVKADATARQAALEGMERLRRADASIPGAVLNYVSPSRQTYGYLAYDGYGITDGRG